jgi:hypothetical protein
VILKKASETTIQREDKSSYTSPDETEFSGKLSLLQIILPRFGLIERYLFIYNTKQQLLQNYSIVFS